MKKAVLECDNCKKEFWKTGQYYYHYVSVEPKSTGPLFHDHSNSKQIPDDLIFCSVPCLREYFDREKSK